ncbi:MAG TPA: phenylphosphate carboxylase subunit delta [Planctomycetota bacterium]|nr:phenylphosphate carboxylase subunit delta [Planctomycetota bacterium]
MATKNLNLKDIKLLVLDVDGVLTDGRLYFSARGEEMKVFDARDGAGIKYLLRAGVDCAFLTGREGSVALARARELGVKHVIGGAKEKEPVLRGLLESMKLAPAQAAFVGDDLVDLPPMRIAGWSACPADAAAEVREAAAYVASAAGGHGAVREIIEHLLKEQGRWAEIMARYRPQ